MVLDNLDLVVKLFGELHGIERRAALIQLLDNGKIDFPTLSEMYVEQLRKQRELQRGQIAVLGMHLSIYCMNDKSDQGKTSRRLMYESGAMKGSKFGDQLETEFGNK